MRKSKFGFTLIEIIVVLAILAVIAAIAVPVAFGAIEKTRQSVCENNRIVMTRVSAEEEALQGFKFTALELDQYIKDNDVVCPSGGRFLSRRINGKVGMYSILITCTVHGAMPGDTDSTYVSRGLLLDYMDFIYKNYPGMYNNNDDLRTAFYAANGNKWPTFEYNGKTYYIQPYYQGVTAPAGTSIENKTWLYATDDPSAANGQWNVPFVFNPNTNEWYGATTLATGNVDGNRRSITFNDITALEADLNKKHSSGGYDVWSKVDGYIETASKPMS